MYSTIENKKIDEGLVVLSADYVYALRIIKYLTQTWEETDAFKLGLIDKEGNKIRAATNIAEKSAYSPFVRLMFNLKRMTSSIPGGTTKVGGLAAAYLLMKEEVINSRHSIEVFDTIFDKYLLEDTVVNTTSGATAPSKGGYDLPLGKMIKRNKKINSIT